MPSVEPTQEGPVPGAQRLCLSGQEELARLSDLRQGPHCPRGPANSSSLPLPSPPPSHTPQQPGPGLQGACFLPFLCGCKMLLDKCETVEVLSVVVTGRFSWRSWCRGSSVSERPRGIWPAHRGSCDALDAGGSDRMEGSLETPLQDALPHSQPVQRRTQLPSLPPHQPDSRCFSFLSGQPSS